MDAASHTINRQAPVLPKSLYFGMTPEEEKLGNRIVRNILHQSNIHEIIRWYTATKNIFPQQPPLIVTDEDLKCAEALIPTDIADISTYLESRGINATTATKYKMCSTARLTASINQNIHENLGLELPKKYANYVPTRIIHGVSIPYYFDNKFCGFVTRVIGSNSSFAKYAFTCHNRFCYGLTQKTKEVHIVEGVFDAISMIEAGHNTMGLGDSQPNYFKMWVAAKHKYINLLFDGDYAGYLGATKAYIILTKLFDIKSRYIKILSLPRDHDPAKHDKWVQISYDDLLDIISSLGSELDEFKTIT